MGRIEAESVGPPAETAGDAKPQKGGDKQTAPPLDSEWNVSSAPSRNLLSRRLQTFNRIVAYARGTGWRGYEDYIGARLMYPESVHESISMVLQSAAVKGVIQQLARRRARQLLEFVHDGRIDPEVVDAYTKYAYLAIDPEVRPGAHNTVPWTNYLHEDEERPMNLVQFYTAMRCRVEKELQKEANRIMEKSVARVTSKRFSRAFALTINEVLVSMYNQGTHVNVQEIESLRRVASQAAQKKQSILFVPCHKSHIDYLVVSWLMYRIGISLPHIIAGENLDLPVVGSILRSGGAFFIRRSFQDDALYPVVIKEYISTLLEQGKNLECFIEGTRSRTGKLLPPKYGILKYIVGALRERRTTDVLVCPVSLQYDSVIESGTYVDELLGKPKESESLSGLVSGGSSLLQLKMGRIDVRFKTPWSLQDFLRTHTKNWEHADAGNEVQILKSLGYRILYDINSVSVVTSAALVATVILTLRGRGIGRSALIGGILRLRQRIIDHGYQVAYVDERNAGEVVDRALAHMKGLVVVHNDLLEPTIEAQQRFQLSLYRNQVMHIFVHETLLSVSLYTRIKRPMQMATYNEIHDALRFISQVFRDEFVFRDRSLDDNIRKTIELMCRNDVLMIAPLEGEGHATYTEFSNGRALLGVSDLEIEAGRDTFDSYLFLIWPYVESYWLAAISLFALAPQVTDMDVVAEPGNDSGVVPWYSAKDLESCAQRIGKTLYRQGQLSYLESVNGATLSNAFVRMHEMGITVHRKTDDRKPLKLVTLHPDWIPQTELLSDGEALATVLPDTDPRQRLVGRLVDYHEQLAQYRREGKDRRDQSIGNKVLNHVFTGGPKIVQWASFDPKPVVKL